jgi:hypothetical protein
MNAATVERPAPASDSWAVRALVALTQRAHECLARAGSRELEAWPAAVRDESTRFMSDVSGGGSRAQEAARTPDR